MGKKIKKPDLCSTGDHHFIVSHWKFDAKKQYAVSYTCQRCLLSIDGNLDVDTVKAILHAKEDAQSISI
jgi:hypothetical protein